MLPYVTAKAEYLQHSTPVDPFNDGSRLRCPTAASTCACGVGSKLTLNATVNPDFGQVEVDPAVVNLSDVESFFQEKRPFFVEGSSIFRFGNEGANDYWGFNWPEPTFFYSRRIGRAAAGQRARLATTSTRRSAPRILGAAKLTGKLSPTLELRHAARGHRPRSRQTSTAAAAAAGVGGRAAHLLRRDARAQKEFKDRRQGLGFMATVAGAIVRRRPAARRPEHAVARARGVDGWTFLDKNKTWVISGWSAMSHVRRQHRRA